MRVLAVDLGTKRIGLAISDPLGRIASPLEVIEAGDVDQNVARVAEVAHRHGAELIVVGLPRTLRGTDELAAQQATDFAERLKQKSAADVVVWDERLTTAQAERALLEAGLSRRRRRQTVDKVAAAVLLQSYLDARHGKIDEQSQAEQADP